MYRQIILLLSIIVAANALRYNYYQGLREDGDKVLMITIAQMFSSGYPDLPATLSIGMTLTHNVLTPVTFASYEIAQGFDKVEDFGLGDIKFTNYNTTELTVEQVIYGFDLGEETINGKIRNGLKNTIY